MMGIAPTTPTWTSRRASAVVGACLLALPAVLLAMSPSRPPPPKKTPRLRSTPPTQHAARDPVREPILLELYTAQGSRPCNAADKALSALLRDKAMRGRVLPLAFHVDYWDGLGHRDPFGSPAFSARQREYAAVIRGEAGTPWALLDGRRSAPTDRVGVLRAAVWGLSHKRRAGRIEVTTEPAPMAVKVRVKGFLRERVRGHMIDVVVVLYEDGLRTIVERGENAGRELRNDRVVRQLHVIDRMPTIAGSVTNKPTLIALPANWKGRRFGVVAFLQARPTLIVHAAASVHFGFGGDLPKAGMPVKAKPKPLLHRPL